MEDRKDREDRLQFTVVHTAERRKFKITVKVDDVPNVRVRMLKKSIFQATGIPTTCQALYLDKRLLSDRMTGIELGLSSDTVFVLHTVEPGPLNQLELGIGEISSQELIRTSERTRSRGRSRSRSRSRSKHLDNTVERSSPINTRRQTFGKPLLGSSHSSVHEPNNLTAPSNTFVDNFAVSAASTSSPQIASAYALNKHPGSSNSSRRKSAQSLTVFDMHSSRVMPTNSQQSPQPVVAQQVIISTKGNNFSHQKNAKKVSTSIRMTNEIDQGLYSSTSREDSVKNIVIGAIEHRITQKKAQAASDIKSSDKTLYSEPLINYSRIHSGKITRKIANKRTGKSSTNIPTHGSGILSGSVVEDPTSTDGFPDECSLIESQPPADSPAILPTRNEHISLHPKPLSLSRVSLTDLRNSERSSTIAPQQLEFPAKKTTVPISKCSPPIDQPQLHAHRAMEKESSALLSRESIENANVAEDDDRLDSASLNEDDIELLRQMQTNPENEHSISENYNKNNYVHSFANKSVIYAQSGPQTGTNSAIVLELQNQMLLMQQELMSIKQTIALGSNHDSQRQISSIPADLTGVTSDLSNQPVTDIDDLDKFKQKYMDELTALKTEVEQLKTTRESANTPDTKTLQMRRTSDASNILSFQPSTTGRLTPLTTRDIPSPDMTIELDTNEPSQRSSNVTPVAIRNRLSDGTQRPSSTKAFNISRSQQNSSLLAAQNIKQQIDAERIVFTGLLQQLEIYELMNTFLDVEIELANIERDNMNQALEESKASLADSYDKLSYVLSKTPTFTPDVRHSAEMSLDYGILQREYARLQSLMTVENKQRRILHNTLEEMKGSIRVIVRMRPMLQHEKEELKTSKFKSFNYRNAFIFKDEHTLQLRLPYGIASQENYSFDFYKILDETKTQEDVFHDMSHLLKSVLDGYNVCVLAYGCTGSGKTFTLIGDDSETAVAESVVMTMHKDPNEKNPYERLGLLPRSIVELFNLIEADTSQSQRYEIKCAMIELYLDNILDLLHTEDDTRAHSGLPSFNSDKLVIRQTTKGETYIQNLSYKNVANAEELVGYLGFGLERRHIAATKLNSLSSRSHTVFLIEVLSHCETAKGIRTARSVLTFADLAGSENVTKSHSNGLRLKEAQHINTSLCALGDVIAALSRKKVAGYVPYRNNKLTMILQQSLGNNSKTLLFANISPLPNLLYETLSTLSFAGRVKNVKNVAVKNLTSIESDQ